MRFESMSQHLVGGGPTLGMFGLFALTVAAACQPPAPLPGVHAPAGVEDGPPAASAEDEAKAKALADRATSLDATDPAAAQSSRDELIATYPSTLAAAAELFRRGEAHHAAGEWEAAVAAYEKMLFYRPDAPDAPIAQRHYADALLTVGRHADAANLLSALVGQLSGAERDAISLSLIEALRAAERAPEALNRAVVLAKEGGSDDVRARASELARAIVRSNLGMNDAIAVWNEHQKNAAYRFVAPILLLRLGKVHFHIRDYERAEKLLSTAVEQYAGTPEAHQARELLERLRSRFAVDPKAIGVVLPLSGKLKQFGERSLAAIKLVFPESSGYKLIVKDTEDDTNLASKAVEELVLQDHVVAILGPISQRTALPAALKSEELSVPILTLSYREGLPQLGPHVFRTALTIEAQAKVLAKTAIEKLGMRRFALLYPKNQNGTVFVDAFWDEVDAHRGEITGIESYDVAQTTFAEQVQRLVGRYYKNARHDWHEKVRELKAQKLPSHRMQSAIEKLEKGLPPIVDFDAIVIPDSSNKVSLIVPALAFEDIVLTQDKKALDKIKKALGYENIKPVRLLGGSGWNTPETVAACGKHCTDAVFVDAYYPDNPSAKVREFVTKFREATTMEPTLTDAQAYDTAALLSWVLTSKQPQSRKAMREALGGVSAFEGVTGKFHFDKDGDVDRELFILTIREDAIRAWEPQESPEG